MTSRRITHDSENNQVPKSTPPHPNSEHPSSRAYRRSTLNHPKTLRGSSHRKYRVYRHRCIASVLREKAKIVLSTSLLFFFFFVNSASRLPACSRGVEIFLFSYHNEAWLYRFVLFLYAASRMRACRKNIYRHECIHEYPSLPPFTKRSVPKFLQKSSISCCASLREMERGGDLLGLPIPNLTRSDLT